MVYYMIVGIILASISIILAISSKHFKKGKFIDISLIASLYAILFLVLAYVTHDPIEGIPTELISLGVSSPFIGLVVWYAKEMRTHIKKIPLMELKLQNIEKDTSKIPDIDKRLDSQIAVCDERHNRKRKR